MSQTADAVSGNEFFELPPYSSVVIGCNTFTYEIFDDILAATVPSGLSIDVVTNAPNVRVVPDDDQVNLYSFFIRVSEAGGAILWTSLCSLEILCGVTTVIDASIFSFDQSADVASGNEYLELSPYSSEATHCNTFTYELFDDTSANSITQGLSVDTTSNFP